MRCTVPRIGPSVVQSQGLVLLLSCSLCKIPLIFHSHRASQTLPKDDAIRGIQPAQVVEAVLLHHWNKIVVESLVNSIPATQGITLQNRPPAHCTQANFNGQGVFAVNISHISGRLSRVVGRLSGVLWRNEKSVRLVKLRNRGNIILCDCLN